MVGDSFHLIHFKIFLDIEIMASDNPSKGWSLTKGSGLFSLAFPIKI